VEESMEKVVGHDINMAKENVMDGENYTEE
jgi:hypothetical protein